jgi:NAD(P)-dependent dehydrogenase (short-subunit alcohol dehydrogenase family)
VIATCRAPAAAAELAASGPAERLHVVALDVTQEPRVAEAAAAIAAQLDRWGEPRVGLLLNVAGVLHDPAHRPERSVAEVDPEWLLHTFRVNAVGPLLVAKHLAKHLQHDRRAVLANVSAKVGSIGDNALGGWHAYRASKAAQNMLTRNLAIELTRKHRELVVVALHPGTVDTAMSAPFRRSVPADKLQPAEAAAAKLLAVIAGLDAGHNGRFFAYDGAELPW